MDPPMATLTKNDGTISLLHCQEWNILCAFFISNFYSKWSCNFWSTKHIWIIRVWCFESWNFCEYKNSFNSANVNHLPNALHIHSSIRSWSAFSIRAPTEANVMYVESRLERENLISYYHFRKWVTVLRKFANNDVGENLNVNMSTVSGTRKNAIFEWTVCSQWHTLGGILYFLTVLLS